MPPTLTDAIRRIRSILNEPAYPTLFGSTPTSAVPRFYTDTELTSWINDGLKDISRRAETLITYDTTIQIPAYGENPLQPIPTYALPNDIIRVNRCEFQVFNDSSQIYPMEFATQNQMDAYWAQDQLSTATYPGWWMTRGNPGGTGRNAFVIQLYPNPGQRGQLNLFYYRMPVILQNPVANPAAYTSTLDIIEGWDDMVIDYVHYHALIKARNPSYKDIQALYEQKVEAIINQTRQFSDQPRYFSYDQMMMPWGSDFGGY